MASEPEPFDEAMCGARGVTFTTPELATCATCGHLARRTDGVVAGIRLQLARALALAGALLLAAAACIAPRPAPVRLPAGWVLRLKRRARHL